MTVKHNKLYYEKGRNGYVMSDTINPNMKDIKRKVSPVPKEQTTSVSLGKVNPKMLLSKEDLADLNEGYKGCCKEVSSSGIESVEMAELTDAVKDYYSGTKNHHRILKCEPETIDDRVPNYYIGNNGYEARKVIDNFDLSYNVGTATTYLLRCGKKKEQGMTDNEKHIEDIQKAINHLQFEIERLKE